MKIESIKDHVALLKKIKDTFFHPHIALCLLGLGIFLPFTDKAFHIDDPFFLWTAERILVNGLDFYGFSVNWFGQSVPAFVINQNPPLFSYYIAGIARLFGWNETVMHLSMLLPNLSLVYGTYLLASRIGAKPVPAALITMCSPVFVLSGTTVMCDTLMLSFWVWAVHLWICGMKRTESNFALTLSAFLIAASCLTKYFGLCLIPLLAAYSLYTRVPVKRWAPFFLIPISILIFYEIATYIQYGTGLFGDAVKYAVNNRPIIIKSTTDGFLLGLSFLGGGVITAFFIFLFSIRGSGWLLSALIVTSIFTWVSISRDVAGFDIKISTFVLFQFTIFVVTGLGILWLTISEFWERREASSFLLMAWVIGTFVFAAQFNWTVNGRAILPVLPAVGIIFSLQIPDKGPSRKYYYLALLPALLISMVLAHADYRWAGEYRKAAEQVSRDYQNHGQVFFQGHWGYQYYMEKAGFHHIDSLNPEFKPGDVVASPSYGTNIIQLGKGFVAIKESRAELFPCVSVINSPFGVNFYMTAALPYAFGPVAPIYFYLAVFNPYNSY